MTEQPTIAAGAVAKLLSSLPALGLDPPEICAAARFDARGCADACARVPLSSLHALWEVVEARTGRADLALVTAEGYQPGDYGLVGFVAMSCPTLGDALVQVERYIGLWTDDPSVCLRPDGRVEVVYRSDIDDRPGLRRATEATIAEVLHGARIVTQRRIAPVEVCFRHPAPHVTHRGETFAAFFGAPVRFGQPATWIRFDPADLAAPLPRADDKLRLFLSRLASDALDSKAASSTLVSRLREIVADELRRGVPSIDAVARRLAMSGRTLRRRLDDEGTTFSDVIDETRADMARAYVRDRRLPLTEVAFLLGFSEPSAFHRAFKRWTGSTPGVFRQGMD